MVEGVGAGEAVSEGVGENVAKGVGAGEGLSDGNGVVFGEGFIGSIIATGIGETEKSIGAFSSDPVKIGTLVAKGNPWTKK